MSPPIGYDICKQIADAERSQKRCRRIRDILGLIAGAIIVLLAYGWAGI